MKDDIKFFIKNIFPIVFLIGLVFGMLANNIQLFKKAEELEQRLEETQELLSISNDQLKQICMYQEREYYMNQEVDADD